MNIDNQLIWDIREFLDSRQDADYVGDPPGYAPNQAMRLLLRLDEETKDAFR